MLYEKDWNLLRSIIIIDYFLVCKMNVQSTNEQVMNNCSKHAKSTSELTIEASKGEMPKHKHVLICVGINGISTCNLNYFRLSF